MHSLFRSPFFHFEAVRILGESAYGGSEIAECLDAFGNIKDKDPQSWARAWSDLAAETLETAHEVASQGFRTAARNAYLRASNYVRASTYMSTGTARFPPAERLAKNMEVRDLFLKAAHLFDHDFRVLEVPFEGALMPAYLYLPPQSARGPTGAKWPVVINTGGADSVQEELYFMFPSEGPVNGYAVITFDGPGQGLMLYKNGYRMRPDWESVTSAVLDYLEDYVEAYPELDLDLDRIAVAGASLGGYFALRAAADPRFKACIAIDPFYDLWDFVTAHVGPRLIGLWVSGWLPTWMLDNLISFASKLDFRLEWEISQTGQMFGKSTPTEILLEMRRYTLKTLDGLDTYLGQVRCPVFVSGATDSLYISDLEQHTMRIFRSLSSTSEGKSLNELWLPPKRAGSGALQAKMGALRLVNIKAYTFLDSVFNVQRLPVNGYPAHRLES